MNRKTITIILALISILIIVQTVFAATRTFEVSEGDFVKIKPEAVDVDNDKITFTYTPPLDAEGEWQTDYDDAGTYDVTITASDSTSETTEDVTIIVKNTNQPPFLVKNKLSAQEKETINLKELVQDPDDDALIYSFTPPFNKEGEWQPGYNDAGSQTVVFHANDGEFNERFQVEIKVLDKNQPPTITQMFSTKTALSFVEDSTVEFSVQAQDNDDDPITYSWLLNEKEITTKLSGAHYFDHSSAGEYTLKLVVGDGINTETREWVITIENENRKPEVSHVPIIVHENEKVTLNLPATDIDGDALTYTYKDLLNEDGEWQTNYEDAGEYTVIVTASDGEFTDTITIPITVLNVNRAPTLILPSLLSAYENEELSWIIETYDPDEEDIEISITNTPLNAKLNQKKKTFTWKPDYTTIQRKDNAFTTFLSAFGLEKFLLKKKTVPLHVEVCDKSLCSVGTVNVIVHNTNRPPILQSTSPINVTETETVSIQPTAVDPDGDFIRYTFSDPVHKKTGKWETHYEAAGVYQVNVTASDGEFSDSSTITLTVHQKNREPSIKIKDDTITVNEGQEFSIDVTATDPDNDNLNIVLENIPPGASFVDGTFTWVPQFNSAIGKTDSAWHNFISSSSYLNRKLSKEKAVVWLSFVASDGTTTVNYPVKVTIKNTNQPPTILDYLPQTEITVKQNEPTIFHATAKDPDNDPLKYTWTFSAREGRVKGTDTVERTFTTPGKKKVRLSVSDGRDTIVKEWHVTVTPEEYIPPAPQIENDMFNIYVITR